LFGDRSEHTTVTMKTLTPKLIINLNRDKDIASLRRNGNHVKSYSRLALKILSATVQRHTNNPYTYT